MNSEEIKSVVKEFVSDDGFKLIGTTQGEYNKVYIFSTKEGNFALRTKKKPVVIDKDALSYEIEFMNKLSESQRHVHVPKNFKTKTGDLVFENENAFFNLQNCVPGEQRFKAYYETQNFTLQDVEQMFRALAHVHNTSSTFVMETSKPSPTVFDLLAVYKKNFATVHISSQSFSETIEQHLSFLVERIETLEKKLHQLQYEKLPTYPVHYDLNINNVLWSDTKVVSMIDFDWAQHSTFYFDFCRTAMLTCGNFTPSGSPTSLLIKERLLKALEVYNGLAKDPLENRELVSVLLDVSSLFISNWALEAFKEQPEREEYLLAIFKGGVDRLNDAIQL